MERINRHLRRDEQGMTVLELSVVVAILAVVVSVMFGFLDQISSLSARTDAHARVEGEAQLALRTATQNIRSALPVVPCTADGSSPALPSGYANCIKVKVPGTTSAIGACPYRQFVYALVDYSGVTKLVENREVVSCAGTSSEVRRRRVLLENVVNTGAEPLFTYYNDNGSVIAATDTAAVPRASSIKMFLRVKYAQKASTLSFSGVVAPRNNR